MSYRIAEEEKTFSNGDTYFFVVKSPYGNLIERTKTREEAEALLDQILLEEKMDDIISEGLDPLIETLCSDFPHLSTSDALKCIIDYLT